jgi:hypothetical protein
MDVEAFLETRLDRAAIPLAVGDVVAILVVLTIGANQHNPTDFLIENPLYLLGIYAPFLIGWVLVAPLVGAYSPGAVESAKASLPLVIRSWVPAALIGLGLRATPIFHGGVQLIFVAVMVVTGAVALAVWRVLYFKIRS